jgi:hypothetical protein
VAHFLRTKFWRFFVCLFKCVRALLQKPFADAPRNGLSLFGSLNNFFEVFLLFS